MIETLEGRRLFAGPGSVEIVFGNLMIEGTDAADTIQLQSDPGVIHVNLNGQVSAFNTTDFNGIRIDGRAGGDLIVLGKKLSMNAVIFGGGGNDTISGGAGNDTIFGGNGNDHIDGREGNDYIDAQTGNDHIQDYLGQNVCHGGAGDDTGYLDPGLLSSGIEHRKEVLDRDEPPTPSDIYDISDRSYGSGTYLLTENGRTILEYYGEVGTGGIQISFSPVMQKDTGEYEVRITRTAPPYGSGSTANMKYYFRRWDVTGAIQKGLIFSVKTIVPGSTQYHVATSVTHNNSELLLPINRLTIE